MSKVWSDTPRSALKKARTQVESAPTAKESDPRPLEADGLPAGEDDTVAVVGKKKKSKS